MMTNDSQFVPVPLCRKTVTSCLNDDNDCSSKYTRSRAQLMQKLKLPLL